MKNKGFTLIELMVVIAIIGILANFAISFYQSYIIRVQVIEAIVQMDGLKQKIHVYFQEDGDCIDNLTVKIGSPAQLNDIAQENKYSGHYIANIKTRGPATFQGGCNITAQFKDTDVNYRLRNKTISYRLDQFDNGTPSWFCYSTDMLDKDFALLPRKCRFHSFSDAKTGM